MCTLFSHITNRFGELTDSVHGNDAVSGLTEGPGPSQVLSTNSEDVGESLHQASYLHFQRVEESTVNSGPVFAVHLLPLNPVAQDGAAIVLRLMPGDFGRDCCHLMDSGGVGSIRRICWRVRRGSLDTKWGQSIKTNKYATSSTVQIM